MIESDAQAQPRWRRLPEERPLQIVRAAFEVFGEHGLAAARLEDIAKRAGVSKGTIYLYFPNKEALFEEMIRETMVRRLLEAEIELERSDAPATEQLRTFLSKWWDFLRCDTFQTVYRLVHSELHRFPDLARFYGQEVVARNQGLLAQILRRGVAAGEFRELDPAVTARLVGGTFVSNAVWNHRLRVLGEPVDPTRALEHLLDFTFHALRPGGA